MNIRSLVFLMLSVLLFSGPIYSQAPSEELIRLRHDWAVRFLEPEPHMLLARYFRDHGDFLEAYYTLENARRGRFEQKVFDDAFLKYFGGREPLDNSKSAEDLYIGLRKKSPNDLKTVKRLVDIYVSRDDFAQAEPLLKFLTARDPDDFSSVAALAEIYRRQKNETLEKAILADFEKKHPNAAGSYSLNISRTWNSDPQQTRLLVKEAIEKYPADAEFWGDLALLDQKENRLAEAEANFIKAADLDPKSVDAQGQAAFFFFKTKPDPERALKYFLNAYLLDPHAHYGGFAEANIAKLNVQLANERFESHLKAGKKAIELLADPNPLVVGRAADAIAKVWDGEKVEIFVRLMAHDDVLVRWFAMQTIVEKEGRAFAKRLAELLNDNDLRVRGLAAYMAVQLWKEKSFPEMKKMLVSDIQILKFDAISALVMYGGSKGKAIVRAHRKIEKNDYLKKLIDVVANDDKQ